jgi:gliding motility-associated-like protein
MKPFIFVFCLVEFFCIGRTQCQTAFTATTTTGCSPIVVNFIDQSQGSPTEWKWDLGNGSTSTLQNPSATYVTPGFYTVKLWTRSGNQVDSAVSVNYIHVFNTPTVAFGADVSSGCNPLQVQFTDSSSINGSSITSWIWDFGDGILSNSIHPLHIYNVPGTFNVTLKVTTNEGCESALRKTSFIQNNTIKAAFKNWTVSNCTPNKIAFQNDSEPAIGMVSSWDFGDGTFSSDATPVHIYDSAGTYLIKLLVTNNGCVDTISKLVNILLPVKAAFSSDNRNFCSAPAQVNFSFHPGNGNIFRWDFGDSTVSTERSPSHVYTTDGLFSVKLVVKNGFGCTDSTIKTDYITVRKNTVSFPALPDSGCVPFTKRLSADVLPGDSIVDYVWKVGNNISLHSQAPVYTFTQRGMYDISLITTTSSGCRDTITIPNAITAGNRPNASFSASERNACASTNVLFTDLSTGNITSWFWSFGDNAFSSDSNPMHIYTDTGWMTVMLSVSDLGCMDTATHANYIYLKPSVGKFKIEGSCEQPYQRLFTNFSRGAQRWEWDFGDGTTSTDTSLFHTFPARGVYNVTLRTWNDSTACSYSQTKQVMITDAIADFYTVDSVVCRGDSVIFNAVASPYAVLYRWNFGDNSYMGTNQLRVAHVYDSAGIYSVKLEVKDSIACIKSKIKENYIKIEGPKAKFGVSSADICVNTQLTFLDSSLAGLSHNPVKKWIWNYGDGVTDTLTAPPFLHSYAAIGNYKPSLKVIDSTGCSDSIKMVKPVAVNKLFSFFVISDSVACPGFRVKFTCPYSTPGTIYRWDFGDGNSASTQIPTHIYTTEGVYTVKLYVSKLNGCIDSTIVTNAVKIKQTVADFNLSDSFSTCPPLMVNFSSLSANAISEHWSFGDSTNTSNTNPSHYYVYPGNYKVTLTAKGYGACVSTKQKTIVIKGPKGEIGVDHTKRCKPYQYQFNVRSENAVHHVWDFGDGITQGVNDTVVNYIYRDSGNFVPKIILEDAFGCKVPIISLDTLRNIFINSLFSVSDSNICVGEPVSFTNLSTSNDTITGYLWNMANGNSATQKDIELQYNSLGVFYPSLQVTSANGCTAVSDTGSLVRVSPSPVIDIVKSNDGCAPLRVLFNNNGNNGEDSALLKWHWDMGNGDTSILQQPLPVLYNSPGNYSVSVSATNSTGCSAVVIDTVVVFASPLTKISGDSFVCRGNSLDLFASGADTYRWQIEGSTAHDTTSHLIISPDVNAKYLLTGINQSGCVSTDSVSINVYQPMNLEYKPEANICAGKDIQLKVTGAATYKWEPSYALDNDTSATVLAKPGVTTAYTVIGSDAKGCFKDTASISVKVFGQPVVTACEDKKLLAGSDVILSAVFSNDVVESYWSPTDNTARYDVNAILVKPKETTEYTVKVKNAGGCTAEDRVSVFVTCNSNNVFVPNLFSPNNDGVNDFFYPRGTGLLNVRSMRVYNRWGETVFEKKNFNANDPISGWNGMYRGIKLTADVFVYIMDVVCENNNVMSIKGNITLAQ